MPAAEQKKSYYVSKNFRGINTKANRTAIDRDEFSWLENAMPVGYGNLRVVPAQKDVLDENGNVVIGLANVSYMNSGYVQSVPYIFGFMDDGSAEYFDNKNLVQGTLAPAGTFSADGVRISQWKNERILITDPEKGYFTWDGTNLVSIGSVGLVTVTNGGSGYTSPPEVTFSAPNDANGVQATATCSISNGSGSISTIEVTAGGTGYTAVPTVTISAPNEQGGTQATGAAIIQSNAVVGVSVINPGLGYTTTPTVTITGGGGANATANAILAYGSVISVEVNEAGTGYTSPPTITFTGGGGANAAAEAALITFATGGVSLTLESGGSGYTTAPTIAITGGGGNNATAIATLTGDSVGAVIVTNPGTGYTNAANLVVTFSGGGGGNGASVTSTINTNSTVDVQTFSGRAWIAQGRTIYYTSPNSYNDFGSISAGNVILTDSTLTDNIIKLLSANNFLYIFGDNSINVFSDVRVTSTGTTLFTNTNVSASIGTDLPLAIFPYFRSVLFMNKYGVYALIGSTTSKISDSLDGIMGDVDFTYPVYAGQALINNILCAVFNFWYDDDGTVRPLQAVFFEKKWFLTSQGDGIKHIAPLSYQGKLEIYAADDNKLIELYNDTQANVASTVQTALLSMEDPIRTKQALKWGVEATAGFNGTIIDVTVDSEQGSSDVYTQANSIQWLNNSGDEVFWTNSGGETIAWIYASGYILFKSDAQQWGKYLGLTVTSNSAGTIYNTFEFEHELRVRF